MKKSAKYIPAKNVDEYLEGLPKKVRADLEKLRRAIRSAAPEAIEKIGYRIPMYRQNGDLVAFAAFENHCSFITMSHQVIKAFKAELAAFETSGTTIHFTAGKPLPPAVVKRIVKARIKENEQKIKKPKK